MTVSLLKLRIGVAIAASALAGMAAASGRSCLVAGCRARARGTRRIRRRRGLQPLLRTRPRQADAADARASVRERRVPGEPVVARRLSSCCSAASLALASPDGRPRRRGLSCSSAPSLTASSTRSGSSGGAPGTSWSADLPAALPCWRAPRPSIRRRRSCRPCWRSSCSCGRRRISGASRPPRATTMRGRACRCCRSSRRPMPGPGDPRACGGAGRDLAGAALVRAGLLYGVGAAIGGGYFLWKSILLSPRSVEGERDGEFLRFAPAARLAGRGCAALELSGLVREKASDRGLGVVSAGRAWLGFAAAPAHRPRLDPGAAIAKRHRRWAVSVGGYVLTDRPGAPFSLADYRGKPLVISLVYSSCSSVCPPTTQHLSMP